MFDPSLKGMTTHHMLLHTNETYKYEMFNGWNFTKFHYWDMFLYEPATNKLFETNSYKLFEEEIDMITVRSASSIFKHKARNVTKTFLGFVLEKEDVFEKILSWRRNLNIDAEYKVPVKNSPFKDSTMTIMMDTDFTEKNYEIHYFGYMDILGIIGGLNASIGPLLAQFGPLFIMNYLY